MEGVPDEVFNAGAILTATVFYPMATKALKESEVVKEAKRIEQEQSGAM